MRGQEALVGMQLGSRGVSVPPAHKGGGWERRRKEGSLESAIIKEGCLGQMQARLEQHFSS